MGEEVEVADDAAPLPVGDIEAVALVVPESEPVSALASDGDLDDEGDGVDKIEVGINV